MDAHNSRHQEKNIWNLQLTSYVNLEGTPLIWMMPLHLYVNKIFNSKNDDDVEKTKNLQQMAFFFIAFWVGSLSFISVHVPLTNCAAIYRVSKKRGPIFKLL